MIEFIKLVDFELVASAHTRMAPKIQKVKFQRSATSSSNSNSTPSTPSSSTNAGPSSKLKKGGKPKFFTAKLQDVSETRKLTATVHVDEISQDGRRMKRKTIEAEMPSPVKRKCAGLTWEARSEPLNETLQSVLLGFSQSGFEYVADSRNVLDVGLLLKGVVPRSKRRYLASVSELQLVRRI